MTYFLKGQGKNVKTRTFNLANHADESFNINFDKGRYCRHGSQLNPVFKANNLLIMVRKWCLVYRPRWIALTNGINIAEKCRVL